MMASSIWPTEYYDSWPMESYEVLKIWDNLAEIVNAIGYKSDCKSGHKSIGPVKQSILA